MQSLLTVGSVSMSLPTKQFISLSTITRSSLHFAFMNCNARNCPTFNNHITQLTFKQTRLHQNGFFLMHAFSQQNQPQQKRLQLKFSEVGKGLISLGSNS